MNNVEHLIPAWADEVGISDDSEHWFITMHGRGRLPDDVIKALSHGAIWVSIQVREAGAIIDMESRKRLPAAPPSLKAPGRSDTGPRSIACRDGFHLRCAGAGDDGGCGCKCHTDRRAPREYAMDPRD